MAIDQGSGGLMRGKIDIPFWKQLHFGFTLKLILLLVTCTLINAKVPHISNSTFSREDLSESFFGPQQHLGSPKPVVWTHSYLILPNSFLRHMKWYFHLSCMAVIDGRNSAPIYIMENLTLFCSTCAGFLLSTVDATIGEHFALSFPIAVQAHHVPMRIKLPCFTVSHGSCPGSPRLGGFEPSICPSSNCLTCNVKQNAVTYGIRYWLRNTSKSKLGVAAPGVTFLLTSWLMRVKSTRSLVELETGPAGQLQWSFGRTIWNSKKCKAHRHISGQD